jgi:hypothetical protein
MRWVNSFSRAEWPTVVMGNLFIDVSVRSDHGISGSSIRSIYADYGTQWQEGIHVVTGERARNVRFYEKNEFRPLATAHWNGADVVFMGRLFRPR